MVYFVGAGPGAADLITVRGKHLLEQADVIIYAGSLVNRELLRYAKEACEIYDSARMTLEEVLSVMERAAGEQKSVVRLHTGDPSIYGAVREQMDALDEKGIPYSSCPGVSACFGAAASLNLEYTLPDVSQSLIITRMAGKTFVPEKRASSVSPPMKRRWQFILAPGRSRSWPRGFRRADMRPRRRRRLSIRRPGRRKRAIYARLKRWRRRPGSITLQRRR